MWDMQIVRLFTVRVLVLGSRAGGKIQDFLCMKKTPTKERTMLDYYFLFYSYPFVLDLTKFIANYVDTAKFGGGGTLVLNMEAPLV